MSIYHQIFKTKEKINTKAKGKKKEREKIYLLVYYALMSIMLEKASDGPKN